jgi:hypothetical protein
MKLPSIKLITALCFTSTILTGCSTITPMSPETKQSVHTVSVDNNINVAKTMYYLPPSAYLPIAFGGLIGAAVTADSTAKGEEELRNKAISNHVLIDQIVRDQFIKEINAHDTFKLVTNKNSDATLIIAIPSYGISIPSGFSTQLSPIVTIDAKLIRNGNVIWSYKTTNALALSGVPRYTLDEINKNPLLLKEMWTAEANILVSKMVSTM